MAQSRLSDPFVEAFSALSVTGPPRDRLFTYKPIHSAYQPPAPVATPKTPVELRLEPLTATTYNLELRLDSNATRNIFFGRRKFASDIRQLFDDITHLTELNATVTSATPPKTGSKYYAVTEIFWSTIRSLFEEDLIERDM